MINKAQSLSTQTSDNRKQCWVCFATEDDDLSAKWLRPCRCKGSTMWVHESCLQRWVDEKQKGDAFADVQCSQCGTKYTIIYPPLNILLSALERVDRLIAKVCPLITGGVILGSVYWVAVTYGAITLMQLMGYAKASQAFERTEPILLLVGLPTVPILLIIGKMVRWEDAVVELVHSLIAKFSKNRALNAATAGAVMAPVPRDPASATRILCGALILPTVSMLCGKLFFSGLQLEGYYRSLLGGVSFVLVKGLFKIYLKHSQLRRKTRREIRDFELDAGEPGTSGLAPYANSEDDDSTTDEEA